MSNIFEERGREILNNLTQKDAINDFMLKVVDIEEYKDIEYLIFSIRKDYLNYMSNLRLVQFQIPEYLEPLVDKVIELFNMSGISTVEMLHYMLENDVNNWVHYYASVFIISTAKGEKIEPVKDLSDLYVFVITGYILDTFRDRRIDIKKITEGERLLHKRNQYGLSIVNGVEFCLDYFVFEGKAYLYSILTNTNPIQFGDTMPGFAKIIIDEAKDGDIFLRLDERLALPLNHAINYSTLNFEKFRGSQFHFNNSILQNPKTIIVHIDDETSNKLLMVIKQRVDKVEKKTFWHIEVENLPYIDGKYKGTNCITTFLHGMYYPDEDFFTHIDCAKNQYNRDEYIRKYSENAPIDLYTEDSNLHYKIRGIENRKYFRKIWYELIMVSLNSCYRKLLDEVIA